MLQRDSHIPSTEGLPRSLHADNPMLPESRSQEGPYAAPHLLIVDDSPENIQQLGAVLRDEGFLVSVARDGKQALEKARSLRPNLVLMDVMMPDMDGLDVCRRMKSDPVLADIPVIFISAKGSSGDIVEGLSAGGVDYIRRPFQAAEVIQRIKTHLRLA